VAEEGGNLRHALGVVRSNFLVLSIDIVVMVAMTVMCPTRIRYTASSSATISPLALRRMENRLVATPVE
jgi:hypothetical protein